VKSRGGAAGLPVIGRYPEIIEGSVFETVNKKGIPFPGIYGRAPLCRVFTEIFVSGSTVVNQITGRVRVGTVFPSELYSPINGNSGQPLGRQGRFVRDIYYPQLFKVGTGLAVRRRVKINR
jgi:hypothetical protein